MTPRAPSRARATPRRSPAVWQCGDRSCEAPCTWADSFTRQRSQVRYLSRPHCFSWSERGRAAPHSPSRPGWQRRGNELDTHAWPPLPRGRLVPRGVQPQPRLRRVEQGETASSGRSTTCWAGVRREVERAPRLSLRWLDSYPQPSARRPCHAPPHASAPTQSTQPETPLSHRADGSAGWPQGPRPGGWNAAWRCAWRWPACRPLACPGLGTNLPAW
jgi:hypothetical protein